MTRGRGPRSEKGRGSHPEPLWVYSYELVPRQEEDHLNSIRAFLEQEHAEAQGDARTWTGKLVRGQRVTHILIVSDSPDHRGEVNRRLEDQLKQLKAAFSLTVPMPLVGDDAPSPGVEQPS